MKLAREDPFIPVVPEERLHPVFAKFRCDPGNKPARQMIREVLAMFPDRDGNFLEQFQTTGFDARTWELYLFAYLEDAGFEFDWGSPSPDFLVESPHARIGIEAVTCNPTQGATSAGRDAPVDAPVHSSDEQDGRILKLASTLYSKYCRRYWELPQVENRPLIIAIQDFQDRGSLRFSSSSLATYLYGLRQTWHHDEQGQLAITDHAVESHMRDKKTVPSGYFDLPGAHHISGVMFSNAGTMAKFNRMGHQGAYRAKGVRIVREGLCHAADPNASEPRPFSYEVGGGEYVETWGDGLELFHNPNATCPLEVDWFPGIVQNFHTQGVFHSLIPAFSPYSSVTKVFVFRGEE